MARTAVKDVGECCVTVQNDFSFNEQSNDFARADTVRNLDNFTLSRASHDTPLSARVEGQARHSNEKDKNDQQQLSHTYLTASRYPVYASRTNGHRGNFGE